MALILFNPHVEDLVGWRASWLINRRRTTDKYWYFLDRDAVDGRDLVYYINIRDSSVIKKSLMKKLPAFLCWIIVFVESLIWCALNKVSPRRLRFAGLFRAGRGDAVFVFGRRAFSDIDAETTIFLDEAGQIFCHLGHCVSNMRELSAQAFRYREKLTFLAEARLDKHSKFFRAIFPWYEKAVLVIPFVPQTRFRVKKPFGERQNRAVSTGTYHIFSKDPYPEQWAEIESILGVDSLHPLRRDLDEKKVEIADVIEVRNSYFWESFEKMKATEARDGGLFRFAKGLKAFFTKYFVVHQKAYFAFDIVDLYNDFKFSVIVEEIIGPPGVGAFESMACGCAFLGVNSGLYEDFGMEEGVHYIGYDGSFDDMMLKLKEVIANPSKAAEISVAGQRFVASKCNARTVLELISDHAARLTASLDG